VAQVVALRDPRPDLQRAYSGAPRGPGAVYEWTGPGKAGAGRMEITGVQIPTEVTNKLDFSKPFVAHNVAEFTWSRRRMPRPRR
jgi:hypothetical protein